MQDSEIRKLCEEELAKELGFRVTTEWYGGDDRETRIKYDGASCDVVGLSREVQRLWDKCCALLRSKLEAERWIPVSERLPEIEKAVWVWADGAPRVAMRSNPENEGWLWYFSQCGWDLLHGDFEMEDATVTHWRPLPSSPEVQG